MTIMRGMIATVGGSPEPIVKAAEVGRPSHILFIVSEKSWSEVDEKILPMLRDRLPGYAPQHQRFSLTDEFDLGICYKEISEAIKDWLRRERLNPEEVVVDNTGGTKPMSASLTLAAVEDFNTFTYVGGEKRTKGGLGVVVSGTERVEEFQNPWDTYAVRELRRASWLIGSYYSDAAADLLSDAARKCGPDQKAKLEAYAGVARALALADHFDFNALHPDRNESNTSGNSGRRRRGRRGRRALQLSDLSSLTTIQRENKFPYEISFEYLQYFNYSLYERLTPIQSHWKAVWNQVKDKSKTPCRETMLEHIANAERRARQSRYDDAVARLYRAVELFAQILLKQAFGAENGRIRIRDIPKNRQDEAEDILKGTTLWQGRYQAGLAKIWRLLELSNQAEFSMKSGIGDALRDYTRIRNQSTHSARPVNQDEYENFWNAALSALEVNESEIPRWPTINFTL